MNNSTTALDFLRSAALLILTEQCYSEYFENFNFFDPDCFKATLSKCLGLGIIAGSVLVKLPQIIKIYKNKSGEGINIWSVSLDLTAMTLYVAYNFVKGFPFSSWGDSGFLMIQTTIIAALCLLYAGKSSAAFTYVTLYSFIVYALCSGFLPINFLWTLQSFNIFILLVGKLSQAYTNYKNGHTGQLSAVTLILLFVGSLARIFTSIQETGDPVVILTCVSSCFVNAIVLAQLIYYWNVDPFKSKTE